MTNQRAAEISDRNDKQREVKRERGENYRNAPEGANPENRTDAYGTAMRNGKENYDKDGHRILGNEPGSRGQAARKAYELAREDEIRKQIFYRDITEIDMVTGQKTISRDTDVIALVVLRKAMRGQKGPTYNKTANEIDWNATYNWEELGLSGNLKE